MTDEVFFYMDRIMYSGIVEAMAEFLCSIGEEVAIDYPMLPADRRNWEMKRSYRPLQKAVVEAVVEIRYGMVQAPPGVGKTNMMAGAICEIGLPGTFVVVMNERPFTQAFVTLSEHTTIPKVGRLGNGYTDIQDVTVATIQTITSALTNNPEGPVATAWKNAKVVFVDEAHHAGSDGHIEAFNELNDVYYLVGFSATPHRDDDRHDFLGALLGSIIAKITRTDAINHRLSVPLTIFIDDVPEQAYADIFAEKQEALSKIPRVKGKKQRAWTPFDIVYEKYVINNPVRNQMGLDFIQAGVDSGLSGVLSVKRLEHIQALQALDPSIVALHGKTADRERIFGELNNQTTMKVASTLMDEAVDAPSLSLVAMLAAGTSSVKLEQRIRCDRTFEGLTVNGFFAKQRGYVLYPRDHVDFLTTQSLDTVKLLKRIADEHHEHELIINGNLIPRKNGKLGPIPRYKSVGSAFRKKAA